MCYREGEDSPGQGPDRWNYFATFRVYQDVTENVDLLEF